MLLGRLYTIDNDQFNMIIFTKNDSIKRLNTYIQKKSFTLKSYWK